MKTVITAQVRQEGANDRHVEAVRPRKSRYRSLLAPEPRLNTEH